MRQQTLCVRMLGDFSLAWSEGEPITIRSPRVRGLLAYLLLHRRIPQPRQRIAFLFWPDSSDSQARTNLRFLLHQLRRELPDAGNWVEADASHLRWKPSSPFTLDVAEFEQAIATTDQAGSETDATLRLEQAVRLYRGDLLPGFYEDWAGDHRERLRLAFRTALERLTRSLANSGRYREAAAHAEQLIRLDPLDERAYREAMRLHSLDRNRARALHVWHSCVNALSSELGVQPALETQAEYEGLLSQDVSKSTVLPSWRSTIEPQAKHAYPLVGRDEELQQLLCAWHTASHGVAHMAVIRGEAGIGKTRLTEEVIRRVQNRGIVAVSRAYMAEGRLAYSPVADWLANPLLRTRLGRLESTWMCELARLAPDLLVERPDVRAPGPVMDANQRRHFLEAISRGILASGEPTLLVLEDMHWCDGETLEWVHFVLRFAPQAPLLVLGTIRSEEVSESGGIATLIRTLHRREQITEISLGRLSESETEVLAAHVDSRCQSHLNSDLYQQTEGVPLFIVETILGGLRSAACLAPGRAAPPELVFEPEPVVPARIRFIVEHRLSLLSAEAREIADIAAIVGRSFAVDLLQLASGFSREALLLALDELWRRWVIREHGPDSYDFTHDKIRQVAASRAGKPRRCRYHARIAAALEKLHTSDPDAAAAQLAIHYEGAGVPERACHYHERAAACARRLYAHEEAIRHLRKAVQLIAAMRDEPGRDACELRLQSALGQSFVAVRGYASPEATESFFRARELCSRLGGSLDPAVLRAVGVISLCRLDFAESHRCGRELLRQSCRAADRVLRVEAHYVLGVTAFWRGSTRHARTHFSEAIEHYHPSLQAAHLSSFGQDPRAVCLIRLAQVHWMTGHTADALRACDEALELAHAIAHPFTEAYVHAFAAWLHRDLGYVDAVRRENDTLRCIAEEYRLSWWRAIARIFDGWLAVEAGDFRRAIALIQEGMQDYQATGQDLYRTYSLSMLATAYQLCGHAAEAGAALDEAIALGEARRQLFWHSELYRLKGELLASVNGTSSEAERCLHRAVCIGRQQGPALELRAATSLARLWLAQDRCAEAQEVLSVAYEPFRTRTDQSSDALAAGALVDRIERERPTGKSPIERASNVSQTPRLA